MSEPTDPQVTELEGVLVGADPAQVVHEYVYAQAYLTAADRFVAAGHPETPAEAVAKEALRVADAAASHYVAYQS